MEGEISNQCHRGRRGRWGGCFGHSGLISFKGVEKWKLK